MRQEDQEVVDMAGVVIGLARYPRLLSILTTTKDLDPKLRSVGWVMRHVKEIYDAR